MGAPLLRNETISALRECVLIAEDLHLFGLKKALLKGGLVEDIVEATKARFVFDALLQSIDWTNEEEAKPIIHIFEDAYAESPSAVHTIHSRIDRELERDGLRFEDGRFISIG